MQSRRFLSSLALDQIIDPNPLIVTPDTAVLAVLDQMSQVRGSACQLTSERIQPERTSPTQASCALVMEQGQLVGLFTERDLVRLAATSSPLDTATMAEVMTRSVITLSAAAAQNVAALLAAFRAHRIRHLPIVERGQVLGIVTPASIRAALQPLNFLRLKQVGDVMVTDVVQAAGTASVLHLAQLMSEERVSCVVITEERFDASSVNEGERSRWRRTGTGEREICPSGTGTGERGTGRESQQRSLPVGIITERDIVQFQTLGLNLAQVRAQAVMSTPLFPVQPRDSLWSAHQQMLSRHVRRLVVTDEGKLVGLITQSSLLQVLDPVELLGDLDQLQQVLDNRNRELQDTNQQLRQEMAQRKSLEADLRETNAALEEQVGVTAAQLVKTNASLRDSEARYRQLFESNPHPMWVYDRDTLAFLTVNAAAIAHYGYSRAEFLHMTLRDIRPPEAIPALEANIARVTDGIDEAGIWQHLKKDGTAIAVEITSHTLTWQGRRAEMVLAHDVTARVQAEAALRQKTQALEHYSSSLKKLHRISTTTYPDFDTLFADYLHTGSEILGLSTGIISAVSQQTYTIRAVRSPLNFLVPGMEIALADTYCAAAVAEHRTLTYPHVSQLPALRTHPAHQNWRLESYIGTPIYVKGQIYGTLCFADTAARPPLASYETEILELMAQSLGRLIAAAHLETQRQQAEQATQAALQSAQNSENRLRTIIDTEPECVKLVDAEGRLLDINPAGLATIEAESLAQVAERSVYSLIVPKYRRAFQDLNQKVCQGHRGTLEFEIVGYLGTRRWLETHASPLWDDANQRFIQLAVTRDITERKRSEAALRDSEARYRRLSKKLQSITANAPIYIYELDRQGQIVFANRTYAGVTPAQVLGTLLTDWFPQEQRPSMASAVEQAFRSRQVQELEYAIPNPQGEIRSYLAQIAPITTNAHVESAVLIATDTTERRRAEQELERFFALSVDLLCIADFNGYFQRLNPAFEQTLGWTDQELRSLPFLEFVHPGDWAATVAAVEQLASGEQVVAFENRYCTADGDYRWLLWSAAPSQSEKLIYAVARDITDRKQIELALQQERDFSTAVLDTVGALVVVLDRQGQIVRFNRTCEAVTGYSFEEVRGHPVWEMLLPEEQPSVQAVFSRLLTGQFQNQYENIWVRKTGERRRISWSNTALTDEHGAVDYVIATGIDITEQRQAQEKLERSYRQAQLLAQVTREIRNSLELTDILQTTVSEVQNLLACDRVLIYQILPDGTGKTISEVVLPEYPAILGTAFSEEVFPEDCREEYRQGRVRAIADVEAPNINLPDCLVEFMEQWSVKAKLVVPILQLKNPPELPPADDSSKLNSAQSPEASAQHELWGLLIAHQCSRSRQWETLEIDLLQQLGDQIGVALSQAQILDRLEELVAQRTSQLRAANLELQAEVSVRASAEQALRRSETQLRLITDALPVLISYVDAQQRYRFVNQTYEEWFGRSRFQIEGRQVCELVGEEAYQQIQTYINTALSGQPVLFETEVPFKKSTLWVSGTYVPDFGEGGEVKGFFALISDISNLKAMQQMKSEFISVVSHELRTPLTSIHGSLKLLSTGRLGSLTAPGQEMLAIALKNTERLTRLVSDILDLERIESGKVNLSPLVCDAADLLRQAVEAMVGLARAEDITLTIAPVSAPVWADPDGVVQILTNLISNAIKFSPSGSTVWLTATEQEQEVLFQVKDQGRGIPADKLDSIFERFQQVDASDSRSKGGTGLGLAICQEIVRRHGGRIWAESILGEGSTFSFTLPAAQR
ncbi:MAG: PAS domain S-box protein [Cyanophyceae cyanobacterium]